MATERRFDYDVLVIGAGGAGLRAAIAAAEAGVSVALVCKSLLGKAHTVMAEGGIAAALSNVDERDDWAVHFADTMRGGDATLGHHRVRLAEQRLANEGHRDARLGRRDGRAQAGAAGADDEDVVVEPPLSRHVVPSYRMRQSVQMPIEQRRT